MQNFGLGAHGLSDASGWFQSQIKKAEGLLEAADTTAKTVKTKVESHHDVDGLQALEPPIARKTPGASSSRTGGAKSKTASGEAGKTTKPARRVSGDGVKAAEPKSRAAVQPDGKAAAPKAAAPPKKAPVRKPATPKATPPPPAPKPEAAAQPPPTFVPTPIPPPAPERSPTAFTVVQGRSPFGDPDDSPPPPPPPVEEKAAAPLPPPPPPRAATPPPPPAEEEEQEEQEAAVEEEEEEGEQAGGGAEPQPELELEEEEPGEEEVVGMGGEELSAIEMDGEDDDVEVEEGEWDTTVDVTVDETATAMVGGVFADETVDETYEEDGGGGDQADEEEGVEAGGDTPTRTAGEGGAGGTTIDAALRVGGKEGRRRLQQELAEARELSAAAPTSGLSKEARLARVCDRLSERLAEYKQENMELEEMLRQAEARATGDSGEMTGLRAEAAELRQELERSEEMHGGAISHKQHEIESMAGRLEAADRAVAVAESRLQALEGQNEELLRGRQASELSMLQSLRDELAATERRLEEERGSHAATRQEMAGREMSLENAVEESSSALAGLQKMYDERTEKMGGMERRLAVAEGEAARFEQELAEAEARLAREQEKGAAGSREEVERQIAAWRAEAERAKKEAQEAGAGRAAAEGEVADLRGQVDELRRASEASSGQANAELERRFRELTEVLYQKQTQLERVSSEKAAVQIQLERELAETKEAAEKARSRASRQMSGGGGVDDDVVPMEAIGPMYDKLASHSNIGNFVKGGAKLLDATASTAARVLRQSPSMRLVIVMYIIFVHCFISFLIHRLQSKYDAAEEAEAAAALLAQGEFKVPGTRLSLF